MSRVVGRHWIEIDTPALLVDLDRLEANIAAMAFKARTSGVALRPHFKAHKSVAIAQMQAAAGVDGFCVAKLDEADVLSQGGFHDILIATQITTPEKLDRALSIEGHLTLAVDDPQVVEVIAGRARQMGRSIPLSIEIDCGLRRCGVEPDRAGVLARRIDDLSHVACDAVFTHGGHAYSLPGIAALRSALADEIEAVTRASAAATSHGVEISTLSIGSTPTVLPATAFGSATEIRPGNYVFRDAMQVALGSAERDSCALSVATTVMSRPAGDRAVLDAGSKVFGLDRGGHGFEVVSDFGRPVDEGPGRLRALSEEHGIMEIPMDSTLQPGDRVRILPNHACTVSNLARAFHGLRNGEVECLLPIEGAGGSH